MGLNPFCVKAPLTFAPRNPPLPDLVRNRVTPDFIAPDRRRDDPIDTDLEDLDEDGDTLHAYDYAVDEDGTVERLATPRTAYAVAAGASEEERRAAEEAYFAFNREVGDQVAARGFGGA